MSKNRTVVIRQKLLSASVAAALGTVATTATVSPAHAQSALDEVVVTGSRIVQRDFVANSPIVSVESEFFDNTSTLAVETMLNQLPQFVPSVTQFVTADVQPSPTNTTGANLISLRGLGPNRNLVLIDGRRAQPVNALLVVDTNSIPSSAIQRVEVVTGGASATYGADAVSGVVNFIMKKDFEGIDLNVQTGTTQAGDGAEHRLTALFGANMDGGRGNVMIGMEYADREQALQNGRRFFDRRDTDPTMPGTNTFITSPYATWGRFGGGNNQPSAEALAQIYTQAPTPIPRNAAQQVNRDGTVYTAANPSGAYRYSDGLTGPAGLRKIRSDGTINENQQFRIASTPLRRYSVFGRGHYDIANNIELYGMGNYVDTRAKTWQMWSPAIGGAWGAWIPFGNDVYEPSLAADGITTLEEYRAGGERGLSCPATGGCTNTMAFPVPDELRFLLESRDFPDEPWLLNSVQTYLGVPRSTDNYGKMFQLTAGATGRIDGIDGSWDVYVTRGESIQNQHMNGFADLTNYRNIITQANYGRGAIVMAPGVTTPFTGNGGTASCTSGIPIFEQFEMSQDCFEGIVGNMVDTTWVQQDVIEGTVQGRLANMPAGELRFAAGASRRENAFRYTPAHLNSRHNTSSQAIGQFPGLPVYGETTATEVFGELLVPLIQGGSVVESFSLELGARYSDYDEQGTTDTWKALFNLGVNNTIRFRGGMQRANRAPNVGELYSPPNTVVQGTSWGDPCNPMSLAPWSANPATNPNYQRTVDICSAMMGPAGAEVWWDNDFQPITFFSASVIDSGNPNLRSEIADTVTLGFVVSLNNLTLAFDWYEIEINDLIAPINYDTIYEFCLSPLKNPSGDSNNEFCRKVERNEDTGGQRRVTSDRANLGYYRTAGYDIQLNWRRPIGAGNFGINFLGSYLDTFQTSDLPDSPVTEWRGTGGQGGQFKYRAFTTFNYFWGQFSTALRWRYYPEISHSQAAFNPDTLVSGSGSYNILDLNGRVAVGGGRHELRFGIDNLLDRQPNIYGATPTSSGQGETLRSYYDILGRRYYVGFRTAF